jgi:effector-binding domain-containing protein
MPYDVMVKEEPEELVASIRWQVEPDRLGEVIPEAFGRLMACVGPVGYGQGMPGLVMHEIREDRADVEVFMPVAREFDPPGGVSVHRLLGGTMAMTVHTGPYDGCQPAYEALTAWIAEHGRRTVGPPREYYLNDPNVVGMDNAQTEIEIPIERSDP